MKYALSGLAIIATPAFAAATVTLSELLGALLWLIIVGLIFWLLWWLVDFTGVPDPFRKVAKIVIAVIAVIFLINFLLGLAGSPTITFS